MVDFDVKSVIARIELLLAQKEMSKEEFYAKSGISSASYSQWNTLTHKPTQKKLGAAANCLGVSLDYLLFGFEQKEKPTTQEGSELDPRRREAWKLLNSLSDEKLEKVLVILRAAAEM